MRKAISFVIAVFIVCLSAAVWTSARQTAPAQAAAKPSVDEVLKNMRSDLQNTRAEVMGKSLTLNAAQAAKFWPMFEAYQKEQNAIMDEHLREMQKYLDGFASLDDAGALAFLNSHFDRDTRMNALRQKWLKSFMEVLPTKQAVRAMQVDRRLALVTQIELSSRIPLVQ